MATGWRLRAAVAVAAYLGIRCAFVTGRRLTGLVILFAIAA
jgi:hypothetical protein